MATPTEGFPQEALRGSVEHMGDVISPAVESGAWEAEGAGEEHR